MSTKLTRLSCLIAALAMAGVMTACSSDTTEPEPNDPAATATATDDAAADEGGDKGFREEPIGDEVFEGPLKIAGVYFQPVEMEPQMGVPVADSSMHLEADISAVDNNGLGYGTGDFIPGLTVKYTIAKQDGTVVQDGTFMPMNASDGPHYGLNLPKLEAGDYKVTFTIESPENNGWMLHTDEETGVKGKFWTEPIVAEFDSFHWDPATVWW